VVVVGVGGCADGLVVVGVGVVVVWVGVGVPVEVAVVADPLSVDVDVDVPVVAWADEPGEEKIAGTLDDEGPVQAVTAETTTTKVAQLRTVSRTLPAVPGMVMRAFMEPPQMPSGTGREKRCQPDHCPRRRNLLPRGGRP
jgi:hypothetical protein